MTQLEIVDHVFYPVIRRTHGGIEISREDRCFTCDRQALHHRRTHVDVAAKYADNLDYISVSIRDSSNDQTSQLT